MARISTHVLDLVSGRPAAGIRVELFGPDRAFIGSAVTNADGRTELLSADAIEAGTYELVFYAGEYLPPTSDPPFLDTIPIRFRIAEARANYHVPLLLAPHGYSTYRGS